VIAAQPGGVVHHLSLKKQQQPHQQTQSSQIQRRERERERERNKPRPLHLKPTSPPPTNAQQLRRLERARKLSSRKKKLKPAPLSARKKRALGLYEIPKSAQKYSIYAPLNRMWVGYIQEVLWDGKPFRPVASDSAAKLCGADFHGAELEVVRSRCVGRVGVRGIVVKDSKFTFELVTANDEVKIVPKEHSIFRFTIPQPKSTLAEGDDAEAVAAQAESAQQATKNLVFELHGDQFIYRAADRANRKFKSHFLPDL
jgi:ribonuclease P protein subunit POP4